MEYQNPTQSISLDKKVSVKLNVQTIAEQFD